MSVVYRNRLEAVGAVVLGVIVMAGFVAIGLTTPGAPSWFRVLLPAAGLLCGIVFVFGYARVGVYETKEGIKVRDWFRAYDLKWSEIQHFELEPKFDWRGKQKLGYVVLQDGSRILLKSIWEPKLIAALNDALSRARSNPTVSG
jgi:hypothetical protein